MGLISRVSSRTYREMSHYRKLNISETATEAEVKKSFHNLAKQLHPDKQRGKSETDIAKNQERFKDIKKSYEILSNSKLRAEYDNELENEKARKEFEQRIQENILKTERQNKLKSQRKEQERYVQKLNARREKARRLREQNSVERRQSEPSFENNGGIQHMPRYNDAVNEAFQSFGVIRNQGFDSFQSNMGFSQLYADQLFQEFFRQ